MTFPDATLVFAEGPIQLPVKALLVGGGRFHHAALAGLTMVKITMFRYAETMRSEGCASVSVVAED